MTRARALIYLILIMGFFSNNMIKVKAIEKPESYNMNQIKIEKYGVERIWYHYEGNKEVYSYIYDPNLNQTGYHNFTKMGIKTWYLDFDFNLTGTFLFQFYEGIPFKYLGSSVFRVYGISEEENASEVEEHTGGSWIGKPPASIFSLYIEIFNPIPNPIQFIRNRFQPEIKISIIPMDSRNFQITQNMRNIIVLIQIESEKEIKTMEKRIYLDEETIDLYFNTELKLSKGPLNFDKTEYTLKITTSDLLGSTTYNEYVILAPRNIAVLRIILIIFSLIYLIMDKMVD